METPDAPKRERKKEKERKKEIERGRERTKCFFRKHIMPRGEKERHKKKGWREGGREVKDQKFLQDSTTGEQRNHFS